ncbi:MAG: PorT family protein [Paludibacteraceae bacterium]|nr:PorT family protein [Paludibacteraceae bacterium]
MTSRSLHLLLLAVSLLLCLTANAQVRYEGNELAVGAHGGVTMTMVTFSPSVAQQLKQGYWGGLMFRYSGEKNLGLQVEANYVQKGWKENESNFSRTLSYVEVPLLSHFFFGKGIFRWIINLGPQISFQVSDSSTGAATSVQHTELVKHRFDYGLCGGTGFEFNTRRAGIYQLEARFTYSFADFFDNSYSSSFQQSSNMAIMVSGAVLFNCK